MSESVKYYDLTHSQRGIWYTEKLYPGTSINNIAGTMKINSKISYKLLEKAILTFIAKNEALHLHFIESDCGPCQYVSEEKHTSIDFLDFSRTGREELYKWDRKKTLEPFNIIDSSLFYLAILKISENENAFYFKIHHLIADGWSIISATNEIFKYYMLLENDELPGGIEKPSYLEYIESEKKYKASAKFIKDKEYWESIFNVVPELTTIKAHNSNAVSSHAKRKTALLPAKLCVKVQEYCSENRTSVFVLFLSALAIYINRITGKEDIVIGIPVLNRSNAHEKDTIGMFISTVPLRIRVDDDLSFKQFSDSVFKNWMAVLKHHKYPYDLLLKSVREKYKNADELYDIVLSYQNAKFLGSEFKYEHEGRWHFNGHQKQSLYIHINDREDEGNLIIDIDYLADIYYSREIDYIQDHITRLLWHALDNPLKLVSEIEMLSEKERSRILFEFSDTACADSSGSFLKLFEKQAEKAPDKDAVIFRDRVLTFEELNKKANQLAGVLKSYGVKPDTIVGIMTKRSPEMLIAIFAVLKAGGAYLPIDPDYPEDRICYMLKDSGTGILIKYGVEKENLEFGGITIDAADKGIFNGETANPPVISGNDNLAYVIYTSGSTGVPKGVMLYCRGLNNLAGNVAQIVDFSSVNTALSITTMSFDIFIFETLIPLANGLKVVIADEDEQRIPLLMSSLIKRHNVDMMQTTPSRMQMIVSDSDSRNALYYIKKIILGGEALPSALVEKLKQYTDARIYNGYGPTETTVYSTFKEVDSAKDVNIGRPVSNTQIYILDKYLRPMPIGAAGEIYIGGDGIGRGYINKPEMTEERFIENPFGKHKKIYKTGDLARWYPKGEIEYLGRIDHQVKIRGLRIELGEIENLLLKYEGVKKVAVVDRQDEQGHKYLCAYYEGNGGIGAKELRTFLLKSLPQYMVPSFFMHIDELPLTPSGKVDRKNLPDIGMNMGIVSEYVAPVNDMEQHLAEIWKGIFNIDTVGTTENFFDIGGDSLFAINMVSRIHKDMDLEVSHNCLFQYPTISELAKYLASIRQKSYQKISKAGNSPEYPLSSQQKRLFLLSSIEKSNKAYNMPFALIIDGYADEKRLKSSFKAIVDRHDSLRTSFTSVNGEPAQIVNRIPKFEIETVSMENSYGDIDSIALDFIKPFDIKAAPLIRAKLLKLSDTRHVLMVDMHHIISDRASIAILVNELVKNYHNEFINELQIQYKDYAVWQKALLQSSRMEEQRAYWKKQFEGEIPVLELPLDFQRPMEQSFEGDKVVFEIDHKLAGRLREFAHENRATMYMLFLAAYNVLLHKYSGQEDIIVGSPFSGRNSPDVNELIGMFVNTIVLRNRPAKSKTFYQLLYEVRENTLMALDNNEYPFEELVNELMLQRDISRNPLFDTMLIYNRDELELSRDCQFSISPYTFNDRISKFDLSLQIDDGSNGIKMFFEYSTRLFKRSTVERMSKHFTVLLESILNNPSSEISELAVMDDQEYMQVVKGFNMTAASFCEDKSFQELFEEQADKMPAAAALVFEEYTLTYKELNERSNRLARVIASKGAGKDSIVGIMVHRSLEMIIGILAVFKAGAAYLPIDLGYPDDRVNYILSHSKASMVLTEEKLLHKLLPCITAIDIKEALCKSQNSSNLNISNSGDDLAYVIYTSGTTGRPKGAMIERRSLNNLAHGIHDVVSFAPGRTFVSLATFSFDMFIFEALIPLVKGMCVVLTNEEQRQIPQLLNELVIKHNVDMLLTTPVRMDTLVESGCFNEALGRLDEIILGGEVFSRNLFTKLKKLTNAKIHNGYGPTEATVCATFKVVSEAEDINIGKPIPNYRVYILDDRLKPVPVGVVGELCISGVGLGRGYLYDSVLTGKKFVEAPFLAGTKIYRTGDYARWLSNGEIEYVGRMDHQVKIKGLRIELDEIENQLLKTDGIKKAVVAVCERDGCKQLNAYYESNGSIEAQELRIKLSSVLPMYMVPSSFIRLDKIPLTPNGKVDRNALLKIKEADAVNREYKAPSNEIEQKMLDIWNDVLKKENYKIGVNDNFFELGGDSLAVILVQTKQFKYNWGLTTQDFYKYQTISQLAGKVLYGNATGLEEAACTSEMQDDSHEYNINIKKLPIAGNRDKSMHKVLLTGVTGFLGIHLLDELLEMQDMHVFCLMRGSDATECRTRLENLLNFYFNGRNRELIGKSIHIVCGNVERQLLGLNKSEYGFLGKNIDAVVNSAALVKHYGNYCEFERTNVTGTKNIAEFAGKFGKTLYHISTMSVSGDKLAYGKESRMQNEASFSETDFYIGQNYMSNVYVRSKFAAEKAVFDAIGKGLDAYVLRMGNLTGRFTDGKFQLNIEQNAFYNRLKAFITIGVVPDKLKNMKLEFTPVDLASKAIVSLMASREVNGRVYHLYNGNHICFDSLLKALKRFNIEIGIVSYDDFIGIINEKLKDNEMQEVLGSLIQDFRTDARRNFSGSIRISNKVTGSALLKSGFAWPHADTEYLYRIIKYMVDIGFIRKYNHIEI